MMLEGHRLNANRKPLATKELDHHVRNAIRGSAMLRDAILLSKGIAPPSLKAEPRPFPIEELVKKSCPICLSPMNPNFRMVAHIQQTVAMYYGVNVRSMVSAERRIAVSHPRQVAMYLCCELTHKPYSEIGRRFGGRDHTTVIHARKAVANRIRSNPDLELDVEVLREKLGA